MTDFTVRYEPRSGLIRFHTVGNRIDLRALVDVLLDAGYTELNIQTHEHEEESA